MSTTVDNRIVEMQLDNREFEVNAKASLNTLDKLKEALNMDKASRQFGELDNAANNVNFNGLTSAISNVGNQFSALEMVAIGALTRIGSRITDTLVNGIKSVSIDQITDGWSKYEQKTSSVQTIMSATGKSMAEVDEQLERLNQFTDETSYNFVDMVGNVGKFTSAGVDLESAVTAMQGIANWAGISGANAEQASRAMYNLSQAMGMGSVRTQDWMSIENANMATVEFKQMAIETAASMGLLQKAADGSFTTMGKELDSYEEIIDNVTGEMKKVKKWSAGQAVDAKNFRSTLSDGWFTGEVLTKTLENYGKFSQILLDSSSELDMTATEMLKSVDKYKEGTLDLQALSDDLSTEDNVVSVERLDEIFKELSKDTYDLGKRAFKASQEAKTMSDAINATKDAVSTKWMKIFELIVGNYEEAKVLWTNVAEELYDIFAEPLNDVVAILKDWRALGGRDDLLEGLSNAWENIRGILGAVKSAFRDVFPKTTADKLAETTKNFKEFTERIKLSDDQLKKISSTFRGLFRVVQIVGKVVKAVFLGVWYPMVGILQDIREKLKGFGFDFGSTMDGIAEKMQDNKIFTKITNRIAKTISIIYQNVKKVAAFLKETVPPIIDFIKSKLEAFGNWMSASFEKVFGKSFSEAFTGLKTKVTDFFSSLSGKGKALSVFTKEGPAAKLTLLSDAMLDLNGAAEKLGGVPLKKASDAMAQFAKSSSLSSDQAADKLKPLKDLFNGLKSLFSGVWAFLKKLAPVFGAITSIIGKIFSSLGEGIKKGTENLDLNSILKILTTGGFMVIVGKFATMAKSVEKMAKSISGPFKKIKGILGDVRESMWAWQKDIKSNILLKIAAAIGIIAVSLLVLAGIDSDKLGTSLMAVTVALSELMVAMNAFSKIKGRGTIQVGTAILQMSIGLLLIASAVGKFGKMSPTELEQGLLGMTAVMGVLLIFINSVNRVKKTKGVKSDSITKIATGMVLIGVALKIVASVVKKLGKLDRGDFEQGMIGAGLILGGMLIFVNYVDKTNKRTKQLKSEGLMSIAAGMVVIGIAMSTIASVVKKLGKMDAADFEQGMIGAGLILGAVLIFVNNVSKVNMKSKSFKSESLMGIAAGMVVLGVAMKIIASVALKFANMEPEKMAWGLLGMGAVLAAMALFINNVNHTTKKTKGMKSEGILKISAGMVLIGLAMKSIAKAITQLGSLSIPELIKGILAMGVVLAELVIATKVMSGAGAIAGGIGLLAVAAAINILVPALRGLAAVKWESIIKLGVALSVLAIATLIAPGFMLLGAALALFGAGVLATGVGVAILATGLLILSAAGTAAGSMLKVLGKAIGDVLVYLLNVLPEAIAGFLTGLAENLPAILDAIDEILSGILQLIATKVPEIINIVFDVLMQICQKIIETGPTVIQAIFVIIDQVLIRLTNTLPILIKMIFVAIDEILIRLTNTMPILINLVGETLMAILAKIADMLPRVVSLILQTIIDLLNAIAEKLPDLVVAATNIIVAFVRGITESLPLIIQAGWDLMIGFLGGIADGIRDNLPTLIEKAVDCMVEFILGLAKGIEDNAGRIGDAIRELGRAIVQGFKDFFGIHSPSTVMAELAGFLIGGIKNGLMAGVNLIKNAVSAVGGWIINGFNGLKDKAVAVGQKVAGWVSNGVESIKEVAGNLKDGLAEGIEKLGNTKVGQAVTKVASGVVDTFKNIFKTHSPSKVMEEIGEYVDLGLANGMTENANEVNNSAKGVGNSAVDSLKDALSNMDYSKYVGDATEGLTITPVMDLSNVEAGFEEIDELSSDHSGSSVKMSADMSSELASNSSRSFGDYSDSASNGMAVDNTNVVSAINTLRNEVGALSQLIGKLQVVMDTGALVGQLTVPMDEALGRQLVYGNRGM